MVKEDNVSKYSILEKFRYHDENEKLRPDFKVNKSSNFTGRVVKKTNTKVGKSKTSNLFLDPEKYKDLQPSLSSGIQLLFVGFNPGVESSLSQHHYAHFTNLFWKLFNQSRVLVSLLKWNNPDADLQELISKDVLLKKTLIKEGDSDSDFKSVLKPEDDFDLVQQGIGFTDLILRCTKSAQQLGKQEKMDNVSRLIKEFNYATPRFIVIVGKGIWECIVEYLSIETGIKYKLDKTFEWGRQTNPADSDTFEGCPNTYQILLTRWFEVLQFKFNLYVFPNTSGLVASLKYDEKLLMWNDLSRDILSDLQKKEK